MNTIQLYIDAVKRGDLVEAKKQYIAEMETRRDTLKAELRVEIAEAVRSEGEEDTDDSDEDEDKDPREEGEKKTAPKFGKKDKGEKTEPKEEE